MNLIVTSLLLILFCGCTGEKDKAASGTESKPQSSLHLTQSECTTTIEPGAWEMFRDLGQRVTAGENVSISELENFGKEPSMVIWLQTTDGTPPTLQDIGQWLEFSFLDKQDATKGKNNNRNARVMKMFYQYSLNNADKVDQFITDYSKKQQACQMQELAHKWILSENMPQNLTLHFVPGKPEIRILDNNIMLDTSSVIAASTDQLNRQIVALLYRNFQTIDGENPIEVNGALAITNTLRIFCNEGVANWIGDMPNLYFFNDHPTLGSMEFIPEDVFHSARQSIQRINTAIPAFMESETKLQASAQGFARGLAVSKSFTNGGYAMAATIAGHLGEDQLVLASRSVSSFLTAYQKAALMNPSPLPRPGQPGIKNNKTMPAFTPEVFEWLSELLVQGAHQ